VSDKRTCPACDAHTSAIEQAFRNDEPCPYCGLPAEAATAIDRARRANVGEQTVRRLIEAERRAAAAEERVASLERRLERVREALDGEDDGE